MYSGFISKLIVLPLLCSSCSPSLAPNPTPDAGTSDGGRDDSCDPEIPIVIGAKKTSLGGYTFTLTDLQPTSPIQTTVSPGNIWTVQITNPSGALVKDGLLDLALFMPKHNHKAQGTAGIDKSDGIYTVKDLFFGMPGQTNVTFLFSESGVSKKEEVLFKVCIK